MAFFDVYASVDDAVREAGLVYVVGPLTEVVSAEQREQIAEKVCDFWSAVPITYDTNPISPSVAIRSSGSSCSHGRRRGRAASSNPFTCSPSEALMPGN